jgi:hypothetical protein
MRPRHFLIHVKSDEFEITDCVSGRGWNAAPQRRFTARTRAALLKVPLPY